MGDHWNNSVLTEQKQSLADLDCYKRSDYYRRLDGLTVEVAEAAEAEFAVPQTLVSVVGCFGIDFLGFYSDSHGDS